MVVVVVEVVDGALLAIPHRSPAQWGSRLVVEGQAEEGMMEWRRIQQHPPFPKMGLVVGLGCHCSSNPSSPPMTQGRPWAMRVLAAAAAAAVVAARRPPLLDVVVVAVVLLRHGGEVVVVVKEMAKMSLRRTSGAKAAGGGHWVVPQAPGMQCVGAGWMPHNPPACFQCSVPDCKTRLGRWWAVIVGVDL